MNDASAEWNTFPLDVTAVDILMRGRSALDGGDVVAAANWFIYAERLGAAEAGSALRATIPLLEDAVSGGDAAAAAALAGVLLNLNECDRRIADLFRQADLAGVPEGRRGLGYVLATGLGVEKDIAQANKWYLSAANSGDGYAAYNLALNFFNGAGVIRNAKQYMHWLTVAAERGVPEACARLGDALTAQRHYDKAVVWLELAARRGQVQAMSVLADRYRDGLGVSVDLIQAVRWYLCMLDHGRGDGVHEALALASSMTAQQLREAGRLSGHESDAELLIQHQSSNGSRGDDLGS
ncbi:hypothetical protein Acy02nite_51650 [Actinoplanes cyaneus]|uniref:Sel1 repeat family protein n=1 Tax=Actinoplanes cyaneus TaxID=52696 RepID=A0A919IK85_9ACTN|nr:tetratricopeptide repeat protein [Actinoplanes cyaneus]MCW2141217.1 hypothetical protein [Actinoplanes cyaneus]GID67284.1 hypothetical protein Acy02nite_51650 [Actinoplanes cyaneus]